MQMDGASRTENKSPNYLQLFESLLSIRCIEETISAEYGQQQMRTPVHLGTGQEASAVGVCANLIEGDAVYSHHRAHNHFLASGGSPFSLIAELYGSESGCSAGRGGSVHLTHRNKVFFTSSAILGESIPLAVGSALSFAMRGMNNIAVAFFGDAAWEEGVIYESFNYAAIHSLPVLFICENNSYSTESPLTHRKAENSEFINRSDSFGIKSTKIDGNDLPKIYEIMKEIIATMRVEGKPYLVECETYRWREHVGPKFDFEMGRTYRKESELNEWMKKDPVANMKKFLLQNNFSYQEEIESLEIRIFEEVRQVFSAAKQGISPNPSTLLTNSVGN